MDSLVSTEWLAGALGTGVRVVSASKHLPDEGRDAAAEFRAAHVPGAVFMDLDRFGGGLDPLPADGAAMLGALGLDAGAPIVVYDDSPLHSAARAWWLLRHHGVRQVAILDGGLAKWRAEGRPLEAGSGAEGFGRFKGAGGAAPATKEDVRAALSDGSAQLVDARSPARFAGVAPEPHGGVESGHMPGARNLHYAALFHDDGTWKTGPGLRAAFEEAGVEPERPVIATCGSGVTAAAILFGLHLLGRPDGRLYNGSWAEWGSDPATPKALGA